MISEFILLTLIGGIPLSFYLVDPPNRFHPVSWFGKFVIYFIPKLKHKFSPKYERLHGIIFTLGLVIGISVASYYFSIILYKFYGIFALLIYSLLVLKFTMPILTLEKHVCAVIFALEEKNLADARKRLSFIVGRRTDTLVETYYICYNRIDRRKHGGWNRIRLILLLIVRSSGAMLIELLILLIL
jgi:adenosylcobinamide-phosphate synthase